MLLFCADTAIGQTIDSLYKIIKQPETVDSTKAKVLNQIAVALIYTDTEKALNLNSEAIALSIENKLPAHKESSFITRAMIYYHLNNLDSAKFYCLQAIDISAQLGLQEKLGKGYNLLGSIHLDAGNYGVALQAYSQALEIFKDIPFPSGVAASLNRIGNFYTKREEHNTAIKYYEEALEIFTQLNRFDQIAGMLNNLGICYFKQKDFSKTLDHFFRSIEILEKHGPIEQIPIRKLNIGKTYIELKEYKQAEVYLKQVLNYSQEFSNTRLLSHTLLDLGILKKLQNNKTEAYNYLNRGLKLASDLSLKDLELEYYQNIAALYIEDVNYEKAYQYNQKYYLLKDSLQAIEKNREILLLQHEFENEQHEQKIALLQHEAEKKNIILYALIIGSAFLVLSLILILVIYNSKQRSIKLIHRQKEEISRQKITDLLKDQELNSIKNKLEGQENERKRIAQELHDGIGGTMASIKLHLIKLNKEEGPLKSHLNDLIKTVDATCEEVRSVSHNLVPPVFYNSALTDVIEDFVNKIVKAKSIKVNYEFYPKRQLEVINKNTQIDIYRIIQELVTNAIKHANASEINIYLTKHDDYVNLMVEDDGKGFKNNKHLEGIGLKNIRSRVLALNGKITIDSTPGNGTIVIIDLLLADKKETHLQKANIPENS